MSEKIKVGINGFGRIGRKILRLALERQDIEIVGINDLSHPEQMAHLFQYDSVHGTFRGDVMLEAPSAQTSSGTLPVGWLKIGSHRIRLTAEKDPSALSWSQLGARYVHECTGVFTDREKAALHLKAGAEKVLISAPSKNPDATFCMGVNETLYKSTEHHVVSNASCTTNCLAPLVKVLDDSFGVVRGTMLTVHSYTNDQQVLDLAHKDLRRARAAAVSQIPTTSGAAKAVGLVLPHLKGKLDGLAVRVPTPNVSLVDFTGELKKATTVAEINAAFEAASQGPLKGILGYSTAPLVSIDYNGCIQSSTVDASLTHVLDGNFIKVISWYDNESGFSARMLDLTVYMEQKKGR
jgi:glyceraldehyde 3-phosphate dehydrogenase